MREIKFRAWDKAGAWVDDVVIDHHGSYYQYDGNEFFGDDRKLVLMQYTGLRDKNGIEIYEHDIVRARINQRYGIVERIGVVLCETMGNCIVEFSTEHLFDSPNDDAIPLLDLTIGLPTSAEVLGNIYENGNLLEKK